MLDRENLERTVRFGKPERIPMKYHINPSCWHHYPQEQLQELMAEKETVYAAIQELDFDFKSGKLSVEDHRGLRERHEERAAALLKAIDNHTAATAAPQASRKARREKRRG